MEVLLISSFSDLTSSSPNPSPTPPSSTPFPSSPVPNPSPPTPSNAPSRTASGITPTARRGTCTGLGLRFPCPSPTSSRHEPRLISLTVEAFYDRHVDTMKFAGAMERFLERGKAEELVRVSMTMSRAMYAQLVQQRFQARKCYLEMPGRSEREALVEAELGVKVACGMEMMYQQRKRDGLEGKGSTWEVFRKT
ncbi:hypothetical protein Fmac_023316 [Flemingia macrophylla]|uniref:Uncharacterized protein n=1 Tax=Flemingia macrophylla TaxID=520843 RepID=A0ABD1LLP9_9FABA